MDLLLTTNVASRSSTYSQAIVQLNWFVFYLAIWFSEIKIFDFDIHFHW